MKCDQLEDLILFHAGGAADAGESRAVLEHLASGCPRCAGRLSEAEAAIASLPLAIAPVTPSPEVRRGLMAKIAASPRGASARGFRRSNQLVKVSPAKAGSGRRRSMPQTRSIRRRFGHDPAIQLDSGASREPQAESLAMWPKSRFRSGSPLTVW